MMSNMFKPQDIIAIVTVIGSFILLYFGKDSVVATTLLSVTAFYFGLKSKEPGGPSV